MSRQPPETSEMKWATAICGPETLGKSREEFARAFERCASDIVEQLGDGPIDLIVGFVSPHFKDLFEDVPGHVRNSFPSATFLGCSAGGLIGGGKEVEHKMCVSLTAARMPDVNVSGFHVSTSTLPSPDDPPEKWESLTGVRKSDEPAFILIPDPFSVHSDDVIQGLDFAFPSAVKIGGLASGTHEPGTNALFLNDQVYREGIVAMSLTGNVIVDTVVAQGCKPIGHPMRITRSNKHLLFELDGQPAVIALKEIMDGLNGIDRSLAKEAMFLGLVMEEKNDEHHAGDFLIRNILGIEQTTGALVVGEILEDTRTVQFHVRDAATSADDLRFLLKRYRDEKLDGATKSVKGALLFSCLGRGAHLYGRPNHDSECFRDYLGQVPLGGFFCNGEIGPVGDNTYLHGYTSSFGIFRQK
ncbi:MAG: FIST C-terminal domain-containing protein [Candidatus Obscuribacterales bacterium]|nr:FIST C-terminal domain-containing protein [Candidatus Obscuribacterales bacterium]